MDKLQRELQYYKDEAEFYRNKIDFAQKYYTPASSTGWKAKLKRFLAERSRKSEEKKRRRREEARLAEMSVPVDGLNHEPRERKIVVSLTSFPARVRYVPAAIGSMLRQTMKPDEILLHLGEKEFQSAPVPESVLRLAEKSGVKIVFCEDIKPHTKYYYAMQSHPDDIVITVDDDIIYRPTLIEELYASYEKFPDCVSCVRAHKMRFDKEGRLLSYLDWIHEYNYELNVPSHQLLATGVGGVLYPPHLLHSEVFNKEMLKKTCLSADDLWLKVMEVMADTKVVLCADSKYPQEIIGGSQQVSLLAGNLNENKNDVQMQRILKEYNSYFSAFTLEEKMNGSL